MSNCNPKETWHRGFVIEHHDDYVVIKDAYDREVCEFSDEFEAKIHIDELLLGGE